MDLADPSGAKQGQFRNHFSSGSFTRPPVTPGQAEYECKQCFDIEYMFHFARSTGMACQAI
ncbi:hypothetical protein CFBP5875_19565 [Agrobacterium pusense]|nr:hypothetical protein BTE56_25140 [Agrobacterium pusense]QBJ15592.1 hypothetical protein EYD00_19355 [Agrobacterium sp. 33MFTa1.1]QCL86792.1 hypothetical protein CFBP5875_19565 [Agrobacterium pusense]RAL99354.1 hypothetical protein DOU54_02470 [Agrobacterium sp. MS2]HAU74121.1 hypothetical protein [Agrobacterium sp.]